MRAIKRKTLDNVRLSVLCTELAEIIRSGITVGEGFLMLSEEEEEPALREVYASVYKSTEEGRPVSEAMEDCGLFPLYFLRMTRVAEQTGEMERVFRALAEYYDRQEKLRSSVRSAVAYPLLLCSVVLVVFFVFLTQVLPVFERVFSQIGAQMQPIAEAFLRLGLALEGAKWYILALLCVLAAAALLIFLVPKLRERASAVFGGLFAKGATGKKLAQSRLASVLALAFSGTTNVQEALELAEGFSVGTDSEAAVHSCAERVMQGEGFASAVAATGAFSPVYCRMLSIGERSGSIEAIMGDISRRAQEDTEAAIDKLVGRVEPVAVLVLSLFVGLLLLSVMLPLVGIMSAL